METTVGFFAVKIYFAHLLDRIEQGEEIFITRRRKRVAKLIPTHDQERNTALDAAKQLQSLAQEIKLGNFRWEEWKQYRDL
jgi:antitoxin (DNA-binding transcriptional repressor) of toxin-antitoxin stability system